MKPMKPMQLEGHGQGPETLKWLQWFPWVSWRTCEGFLLLEVMVAVTIVATGLLAALYAFSISSANAGSVQREEIAAMLARNKMTETLLDQWLSPLEDQGTGEPEYTQFEWTRTVEAIQEVAGIRQFEIKVTVSWPSRVGRQTHVLETRILRRKPSSVMGSN